MSRTESDGSPSASGSNPASSESMPESSTAAPTTEASRHNSAPAAEPKQEMSLSESTLHWMVDPEKGMEARELDPSHQSGYDFHAPALARRRAVLVVGSAGLLALIIAIVMHAVASHRPPPVDESADSATQITRRAEVALSQGRTGEAIELAHLAISANPRVPGAYAVVGAVAQAARRNVEAREAYTKYLELAPVGPRAAEARAALAQLPP